LAPRSGRLEPASAGAGAALFLYHRYFLAGTSRPGERLSRLSLALSQEPRRGALAMTFAAERTSKPRRFVAVGRQL